MHQIFIKLYQKISVITLILLLSMGTHAANVVNDPSFEGGIPNADWTPTSTFGGIAGFPICTASNCAGVSFTHTGDWYVWIGGLIEGVTSSVEQLLTIPVDNEELSIWVFRGVCDAPTDTLFIRLDGIVIGTVICDATDTDFQLHTFSISGFNDGNAHNLFIGGTVGGTNGTNTNIFVDDVSIDRADIIFVDGFEGD